MSIHMHESDILKSKPDGGVKFIGEANGCTRGFCMGIGVYRSEEYNPPGIHEDQEGFYVIQGEGFARVGDEEFAIKPGTFFVALKGVPHSVKAAKGKGPVKVLWAHGAV